MWGWGMKRIWSQPTISEISSFTTVASLKLGYIDHLDMDAVRKRFSSVCCSSSSEEEDDDDDDEEEGIYQSTSVTGPQSEHHPYMLCCHCVQDSLLSSNSCWTDYRGVRNWIIILLVLTYAHLILENYIQHGFLIDLKKVLEHLTEQKYTWPSMNLILAGNMSAIVALLLERSQEKGILSSINGHRLHLGNLGLLFLFPAVVILYDSKISTGGAFFSLWTCTVLWLKLYSYQETNRWYRQGHFMDARTDQNVSHEPEVYGKHLTLQDLYYFLLAPTLCYQRNFPHTPKVRINKLLQRLVEMMILIQVIVGIVQQWIEPIFQRSKDSNMNIIRRVEHLAGLVAPTHFLWLLFFFLSHSYLNFCAELLRFGDRYFYGDWWNATTLITFWRNWNIPFEKWCHRHLYTLLVEKNVSPTRAEVLVFMVSAVLCEYVIALPLRSSRMWIFLMMILELLVAVFLGHYFQGNYGNALVWVCLLLGPPLAVTSYFQDHYINLHQLHHLSLSSLGTISS